MRKIVVFTSLYPDDTHPYRGTFVKAQVDALVKNCEIMVLSPIPYMPKFFVNSSRNVSKDIPIQQLNDNLLVMRPRYIPFPYRLSKNISKFFYIVQSLFILFRYRSKFIDHIVHVHYADPFIIPVAIFSKIYKFKIICTCHGSDINYPMGGFVLKKIYVACLNLCKKIITVSDDLKRKAVSIGVDSSRIIVVGNGFNEDEFHFYERNVAYNRLGCSFSNNKKIALYIGRIEENKGVLDLIEAFLQIDDYRQYRLIFVGCGQLESRVLDYTRRYPDIIFLFPPVPHSKVPLWMALSQFICLPSYSEGLPTIIPEAMAVGRPVIATDVGGIPEIINNQMLGTIVPLGNKKKLTIELKNAFEKNWDEKFIIESSRKYTWGEVSKKLLMVYERL